MDGRPALSAGGGGSVIHGGGGRSGPPLTEMEGRETIGAVLLLTEIEGLALALAGGGGRSLLTEIDGRPLDGGAGIGG